MKCKLEINWRDHRDWVLFGLDVFEFQKYSDGWLFNLLFLRILKLHIFLYILKLEEEL